MEGYCRACLNKFYEPTELLQYCESNRRLYIYCTGLQVKRNDTFIFQLCKECYLNLKFSCKFKKQCRTSDKKLKSYLALKRDRESIDFSTYLKNIEDTLTLRLPVASSSSTPTHQKNYDDDDNESTCTSIQNFMSDMLQGEEMLPTEARIIREVIQEEADILDDSLDSHWLQDDATIDNDFGMDFNFTGLSTPHSINNDHCYTPRRLTNDKEDDTYYYTPKDTIPTSNIQVPHDQKDMPVLEMGENEATNLEYDVNNIIETEKQVINTSNQNDMPLLDDCDIEFDGIVDTDVIIDDLESGYRIECNEKPNSQHVSIILNKGVARKVTDSPLTNELEYYINNKTILNKGVAPKFADSPLTKELKYYLNKVEFNRMSNIKLEDNDNNKSHNNEKNIDSFLSQNNIDVAVDKSMLTQDFDQYMDNAKPILNQEKDIQNIKPPLLCELDKYINKAKLKKRLNTESNQNKICRKYNDKCSIDRNLEMALKNDDSQEFALDQLLISPQVSIRSGASTPTINNIIFGNLTPKDTAPITNSQNIAVEKELNPTDFLEEFLKDSRQSTPKKKPNVIERRQFIRIKDLNKLKEFKVKTQRKVIKGSLSASKEFTRSKHKKQNNQNRGYKDINRLKDVLEVKNDNCYETSYSERSESKSNSITETINIEDDSTFEKDDHTFEKVKHSETSRSDMLESQLSPIKEPMDNEVISELPKKDDDFDSISNLLNFDDNQSVDFNISIASDFFKERLDEVSEDNGAEHTFKMPFSPPDNKFDLDKSLCKICDKTFKGKGALKLHFVKIHKQQIPRAKKNRKVVQKNKICPKCGKVFRDASNLSRHMKSHEEPDSFKCEYCTLDFPTRGRFNQHMRSHESEIATKKALNNEQDKGDNDNNEQITEKEKITKRYVCSICGKDFKAVSNLNVHVRRHNRTYTTQCKICQKGFVRKYDLNAHMASHSKELPFECQYCPKKYRCRYLLVGHMYRHLGKEKFKCDVCVRQFVSSQSLKQHFRTEMCVQNRKALDEGRETPGVKVTYKLVHENRSENITEISEDVPKDNIDIIEMKTDLCLDLFEEDGVGGIKEEPSGGSPKSRECIE